MGRAPAVLRRAGRPALASWLLWTWLGCGQRVPEGSDGDPSLRPTSDGGGLVDDQDRDGLCDATEAELGTNPSASDSDHDGLPDRIELVSDHDPSRPDDPTIEELAYMPGTRGASVDFTVRITLIGDGQGVTGWFAPLSAPYHDGDNAERYYAGSSAVESAPSDAARSIDYESAHFAAVLGRTRLSFLLRFEMGDQPDRSCARAYPFRYAIKGDDGQTRVHRDYLLVVGTQDATGLEPDSFCTPVGCD